MKANSNAPNKSEVGVGLKEALSVGVKNAVQLASRVDGFYKNPLIFIPFPPEAKMMEQALDGLGLKKQVEDFVKTLNRAAEDACKKAAPIFLDAIKDLTISDGFAILKGSDSAATNYLRQKTSQKLMAAFMPEVHASIERVGLAKFWSPLASRYNQLPFVKKANPNLDQYVTERAVSGLFKLIANEEKRIRQNPAARVTDVLRRVFGS